MVLTVANTDTSLPALLTPPASVDPKHRILDNLTEAQSEGVKELQRRIRDMFARGDDELDGIPLRDEEAWATAKECCWRFLKANRFDVDKAEAALMKTLQWRREYRPTEISPVEIEEESKSGKAFWSGYDRIGRPILHLTTAKLKSSDTNRLIRFFVWNLENSSKLSPEGIFQVTVTANTKGLTMFNTLPIPDTIKLVSIIQTHYPEKLGCSIDFDPTWVMWALMSIMMAFMDDATKSKMHLASSKSESVNYKIKKKQKTSECPSTRTGFPCPPAAWRRRAARRTTLAAAPSCPRRWATRCRQATFWASCVLFSFRFFAFQSCFLSNESRSAAAAAPPPPLALALNHNLSHNQQHTNIDLTASNPTLNVLNVSGTPQFTSAMEIAGRKSPISFPSKSPSHSRATSKTRAEKESPISNKQLNQTSASVPAGPVATPAFADFNQFRGSSDSLSSTPASGHSISVSNVPLTPLLARSPTPKATPLKQPPALIPIASSSSFFSTSSSTAAPPAAGTVAIPSNLPTKKWILPIHFHDIPSNLDSVNDTLQKAFPFNSGVRPVRKLMTLHDAQLKFGKDPKAALAGLIEAKSWRAIGILAATVISKSLDARDVDGILFWWGVRLVALEKLGPRMAECLAAEVEVFGLGGKEKVCLYQELENGGVGLFKGVENPRYGNLVGWDIRVIWAREPSLRGLVKDSLDRVFELLTESNVYIRQGVDLDLWKARSQTLNLLIVDLMVELGDFRTASNILKGIIASSSSSHGSGKKDVDVCSALVRIELQLGNVVEAAKWINVIELELCQNPSITLTSQLPSTDFARRDVVLINRALYAISSAGDWNQAATHLTELLEYSQSNSIPTQQKSIISIPVIVNNISVCHLYSGNVGQALSHLESLVLEMPQLCGGSASLLFNLATLYDLTDNSLERKRRLLGGVVAAHAGDDLDGACLNLAQ